MNGLEDQTHYQLLGISQTASVEEIKKAYRKLAKKYHPDSNSENNLTDDIFKEISKAYEILSDAHKKSEYDQLLKPPKNNYSRQYRSDHTPNYTHTSRANDKSRNRYKYKKQRTKSFSDIFFRAAIYSMLFIFIAAIVAYLFQGYNSQPDVLIPEDSYPYLAELESRKTSIDSPTQDPSGYAKENLQKELLLELREKEEQKWREQWTDEDEHRTLRKYQERRMEETYEMRNQWQADKERYNQNDEDDFDRLEY